MNRGGPLPKRWLGATALQSAPPARETCSELARIVHIISREALWSAVAPSHRFGRGGPPRFMEHTSWLPATPSLRGSLRVRVSLSPRLRAGSRWLDWGKLDGCSLIRFNRNVDSHDFPPYSSRRHMKHNALRHTYCCYGYFT